MSSLFMKRYLRPVYHRICRKRNQKCPERHRAEIVTTVLNGDGLTTSARLKKRLPVSPRICCSEMKLSVVHCKKLLV